MLRLYCSSFIDCLRGASGKEPVCQCRRLKRHGFDPWVGKIRWSRKWQPTTVFLPGKFHGQRSLAGYSPWGHKESDTTKHACMHTRVRTHANTHTHTHRALTVRWKWKWKSSCSVVSHSLWPHGLQPTRLLCPWNFPGKSTGVGCHFFLQGIVPTQGSNPGLPHCG